MQASVLFSAAREGNVPLVKFLLQNRVDVNLGSVAVRNHLCNAIRRLLCSFHVDWAVPSCYCLPQWSG